MQLTAEQQAIIRCNDATITVNAFAGTGKTSTLEAFARARPNQRILYLAFNKSLQLEAKARFPANVETRTTHSLAMNAFGRQYQNKLVDRVRLPAVISALGLPQDYRLAEQVMAAVLSYLGSAKHDIAEVVDPRRKNAAQIVRYARDLWTLMCDVHCEEIGMVHDGYLKLYQLSQPTLKYDYILFDEAQDANPVTTDMVVNQACHRVFVGDRHQQIYQFRGAENAMDCLPGQPFYLTASHRFGSHIAEVANQILAAKGERRRIKGMKQGDAVGKLSQQAPYAVVCRTNAEVFARACAAGKHQRIHFVGGADGYRLGKLEDTYHLKQGRPDLVKDAHLKQFESLDALTSCAEETDDPELRALKRTIDEYDRDVPKLIQNIMARTVDSDKAANLVLTTAHKSKGLQFDQVALADDFLSLADYQAKIASGRYPQRELEAEINLLYVAVTRAKQRLNVDHDLLTYSAPAKASNKAEAESLTADAPTMLRGDGLLIRMIKTAARAGDYVLERIVS